MRRYASAFIILLVATEAAAQSQAPRQNTTRPGYYGALVLKYTTVTEQGAAMLGGRGGWNVTPSLVLGGGLYGTLSQVDAQSGVVSPAGDPLDIKFESFGLDLEYARDPAARIHLTLGGFLGGGGLTGMSPCRTALSTESSSED